jgi:hypothetical protein
MDIKSCLQGKLAKMSESFQDQGLRILFLLNNLEFIWQSLLDSDFCYCLLYHKEAEGLAEKVEGYWIAIYKNDGHQHCRACLVPHLFASGQTIPRCSSSNLSLRRCTPLKNYGRSQISSLEKDCAQLSP